MKQRLLISAVCERKGQGRAGHCWHFINIADERLRYITHPSVPSVAFVYTWLDASYILGKYLIMTITNFGHVFS